MLTPVRLLGTALAVALLSGCGLGNIWNEAPVRQPKPPPAPVTPPPDERTEHPYTGELAAKARCTKASKGLLSDLEAAGNVGGGITYPVGVAVRSNARWWTVAVATAVDPNGGHPRGSVPRYAYFVTNEPSLGPDDWAETTFRWEVSGDSASAALALACLKRLTVPKPKPKTDDSPSASYTGKPAPHAACKAVPEKLLARLEQVGQVGGAITYERGAMVKANRSWWTVAVATTVHPNGEGYTTENVSPEAFFVTDAPTKPGAAATYFPIRAAKDKAAAKALACLRA